MLQFLQDLVNLRPRVKWWIPLQGFPCDHAGSCVSPLLTWGGGGGGGSASVTRAKRSSPCVCCAKAQTRDHRRRLKQELPWRDDIISAAVSPWRCSSTAGWRVGLNGRRKGDISAVLNKAVYSSNVFVIRGESPSWSSGTVIHLQFCTACTASVNK